MLLAFALQARAQDATFRTTYSGAIVVTPINTNILFLPNQDFEPLLSGSIEYSFLKTDKLGYELAGGYYPYPDRAEITAQFGIRRFFKATAPIGAYWEMTMMGGVSQSPSAEFADPLFGLGLRLGSLRTTRFGDLGFEYGGGPTVMLYRGQTQVRAEFFFGIGFLLGKEILIEH
ncbi:MAG: hypothetical protein ACHQNE_02640 [Candidatus Kapaibacterium sp.]